jgi:uncharacterized protein YcbK (DUF882 family)
VAERRASAHFAFHEFDCHDGTPVPRHAHDDVTELARGYLEPLRREYGPTTIVSGYRTRAYNARVGGAPDSFHVYLATRAGAAADVRCARGRPADWHALLAGLKPGGLGLYFDHVHVDTRHGHARW